MRSLQPEHEVIETVLVGPVSDPLTIAAMGEAIALQQRLGIPNVLADCRAMTLSVPVDQIVGIAQALASYDLPQGWKQAIVRPADPDTAMLTDLWRAAANNRGHAVQVFRDRDAALAWLAGDDGA